MHVLAATLSFQDHHRFLFGKTSCPGPRGSAALQPFQYCAIHAATPTASLLKDYFVTLSNPTAISNPWQHHHHHHQTLRPDVIITDSSLIGGLWMSEVWKIPSIVMATNPDFLSLAVEHDVAWTSQGGNWWNRLGQVWRQRWFSFSLTFSFVEITRCVPNLVMDCLGYENPWIC